jgi:hypothetical protein
VSEVVAVLGVVYAVGVVVGIVRTDAPPAARVGIALLWPLGPLAFAATVGVLAAAALIAFPLFGAVVLLAALAYSILSA